MKGIDGRGFNAFRHMYPKGMIHRTLQGMLHSLYPKGHDMDDFTRIQEVYGMI